jgi:hypothetical protein
MQNKKITHNRFLRYFILPLCSSFLFTLGCQSTEKNNSNIIQFNEDEYNQVIENFTQQAQEYDGLQNTIEFHATLLNSRAIEAQTLRKASILQWEKGKYDSELKSRLTKANENTEVFVSFFTPERKNTDLARSETLWKIFLVSKDNRYEGKAEKINLLISEIQSLYPHHNRWSNAYLIKFPVSVSEVEKSQAEFILTGPVGTKSVRFNSLNR